MGREKAFYVFSTFGLCPPNFHFSRLVSTMSCQFLRTVSQPRLFSNGGGSCCFVVPDAFPAFVSFGLCLPCFESMS